jgi:uncharacterized protein
MKSEEFGMVTETARGLLASMLNKPLYVALRRPGDLSRLDELLEAHLRWAVAAEGRGELFASGPFVEDGAKPGTQGGLTIVRAASEEEARNIVAKDPFVEHGVVVIELRRWMMMEGSFTLNLRYSDQSSRVY